MDKIKMTLAASVTLHNVIEHILFEDNGTEREYPFDLKFKLQRNRTAFHPDFEKFNNERVELIKKYGVEDEEKKVISVPEDKIEEFRNELLEFASATVEHNVAKISVDDVSNIKTTAVSATEMELFMAVMVDDPELVEAETVETEASIEAE